MKYLQARASDFHKKHNICCISDESFPNIEPFKDVVPFLRDSRIFKALTDRHKCYGSHVRFFWGVAYYVEEEKAIHSAVRIKDEKNKDVDLPVKIIVNGVRRVLDLQDKDEDSIISSERLCKGFWLRMGYTGKVAYDEASDYIMNIISNLVLNQPYNISQVIFNHMLDNIKGEGYVMYLRFVQMLIDDQIPNLPKDPGDELPLEHMDSETLKSLDVYRGVKPEDEPRRRQKFANVKKPDYVAPEGDWRHADSNPDNETEGLKSLILKKLRWWFVKDENKKRTPKVTTPKVVIKGKNEKQESSERLVDNSFQYYTKKC
ncbi:hypothetical protein HanIR_Chr09g0403441 [Helianthus annuus]|nr:hypothetical protein HanIR_Chr09g0403441 [Helianthus annuus]KAJ0541385.1 hypothetical protein HanHA89_Chr09g0327841 [Helianthus annuus]KAJ0706464.1 hypothetical protein HanLR1_Chr09g0307311 [Helianthus annuus]